MPEILTVVDGGVLTITLNRPEARNAMNYAALDGLATAIATADSDPGVRPVIVTGAGDYFSAGTDLSPGEARLEADSAETPWRGGVGARIALGIYRSTKPFIAAINGTAVGIGMTMTLPMDFRIAASNARFGVPYVRRGILPESCSSWFLPKIVGIPKALDWALTGRIFTAQEALQSALVGELVEAEQVLERARELAAEISQYTAPVSVAMTRRLLWGVLGDDGPLRADELETAGLRALVGAPDVIEGFQSFREKRPPEFSMRVPDDLPFVFEEYLPTAD